MQKLTVTYLRGIVKNQNRMLTVSDSLEYSQECIKRRETAYTAIKLLQTGQDDAALAFCAQHGIAYGKYSPKGLATTLDLGAIEQSVKLFGFRAEMGRGKHLDSRGTLKRSQTAPSVARAHFDRTEQDVKRKDGKLVTSTRTLANPEPMNTRIVAMDAITLDARSNNLADAAMNAPDAKTTKRLLKRAAKIKRLVETAQAHQSVARDVTRKYQTLAEVRPMAIL